MRVLIALVLLLAGCGGGSGGEGGPTVSAGGLNCTGGCSMASAVSLSVPEVQLILSRAVQEAQARGASATIAVVDRSGNVLAVFRMAGAAATFTITGGRGVAGGLEGVNVVPSEFAAISKALTGAYLSSEGNAFSTRTANQIVQENFNPRESGAPGGPLFGVQFSSLSCSDVVAATGATPGPKGSPLGLAADPGGLPLYKNGTVVGGIGVIADGIYGLDLNISDVDTDLDELVAVAGARGFDAPAERRGDRIAVDGRTLRYVDSEAVLSNPAAAPAVPPPASGALMGVTGYTAGLVTAGVAYSTPASGIRADTSAALAGLGAFVLVNAGDVNRFPPVGGTDGLLTQAEVTRILAEALRIANRARAQIRLPPGNSAQVSIAVVDTNAAILGLVRTPDAPVFGIDVSVQKARTALLFSQPTANASLNALPAATYLTPPSTSPIGAYTGAMRNFVRDPSALANGTAYSSRAVGNLARPFFPDGANGSGPGPLSKPYTAWSPFSTGLQLDLVINKLVANLGGVPTAPCSPLAAAANGIQIFPGGIPIYRGATVIGAVGVSGDGIDQDDMVAFLGLSNAASALGTGIAHAPAAQRADQITGLPGGQLRYVSCPIAPFLDATTTNVCNGL